MVAENSSAEAVLDLAVDALDELKAIDLKVLDVRELTSVTDYMVIASGNSDRQVKALADNLVQKAKMVGTARLASKAIKPPNGCWSISWMWWYTS